MENKFILKLGEKELSVEVSDLAEQTNGSVLVRYGDTVVLATAVMSETERADIGFFPLYVDYEERYYAAGKILGARYIRREGRPSDEAILTGRLIDRAIRPRFPENLHREVQLVITCLSWDAENDPDVLGLLAASCALSISDIPWNGPISVLRINKSLSEESKEEFFLNPNYENREKSEMDLVLAAVPAKTQKTNPDSQKNEILINMIEAEGDEIEENIILKAVQFAEPHLKKMIDFQNQIVKEAGKEKIELQEPLPEPDLEKEIKEFLGNRLQELLFPGKSKSEKMGPANELKEELVSFIEEKYPGLGKTKYAKEFFEKEIKRLISENILNLAKRPDGRKLNELRTLRAEVGLLPRTHGSGLFCRGLTKSLSLLTLGAPGDQRLLEGMEIVGKKRFMHHYNFPPYSVGEIKPMRGPGRREIGHGMLAEKALMPLVPEFEEFPYTMRIVSEILSSNGSTSMASASSSSLALMDAGVPLKAAVAGIAMGLIISADKNDYKILTDIQGPEDHYGDMDLKAAGTKRGITAIQMDVKTEGITKKILKETLSQARDARLQILAEMEKVLSKPREQLSPIAPRILTIQINPEKIREVIGPGGKVINEITDECKVEIDIQPSGLIFITSDNKDSAEKALAWIKNLTKEVKVGEVFQGKVRRILNFGAFVEILPRQEGLVHISELAPYRVARVEDVVKIGDIVSVKVISIDEQGRINLTMKDME